MTRTQEGKKLADKQIPKNLGRKLFFYYPLSHNKGYYHEIIIPLEQYKTGDTAECYHAHGMWLAHDNSIPWTHCYYEMPISPPFSIYK